MLTSHLSALWCTAGLVLAVACHPADNTSLTDDDPGDDGSLEDAGIDDAAAPDDGDDTDGDDTDGDDEDAVTKRLAPSDLAVLFPLPASVDSAALLRLDADALNGPLLSEAQFAAIPVFQNQVPAVAYDDFRIVGMRVDPCFPDLGALKTNPAACRRQIRLVAQPFVSGFEGVVFTEDEAIHLLYDLDAAAFNDVLERLVALRGDRPVDANAVLGVHPQLASEGEDGPTGAALRALILEHVGPKQLKRYTFVRGDENFTWIWGGLDVTASALVPVAIHGLATELADHTQEITANFGLMDIYPRTPEADGLEALMGDNACAENAPIGCAEVALSRPAEQIQAALTTALAIENPKRHSPESVDCASCHQAGPLSARAVRDFGKSTAGIEHYESSWNLALGNSAELTGAPNRVRAFGYFSTEPVLSQRTVNEAAAVADAVNRLLAE
jgi:hypothetical protein